MGKRRFIYKLSKLLDSYKILIDVKVFYHGEITKLPREYIEDELVRNIKLLCKEMI